MSSMISDVLQGEGLYGRVSAAFAATGQWLEDNDYAGNDPYQLDNLLTQASDKVLFGKLVTFARRVMKPYHAFIPKQLFGMAKRVHMAQALGNALAGEGLRVTDESARRRAVRIFQLLGEIRSPLSQHCAWGLPFVWGGVEKHPRHWPMTITTTIVLQGMMDAIHLLDRQAVAECVESGIRFMVEECGIAELPEGGCILFGPGDTRLILNASVAAAALLQRAALAFGWNDCSALAARAVALAAHKQNPDGSWYYSPAFREHQVDTIIDGRHTGYILEGMIAVNAYFGDARVAEAIERGWAYSKEHLIDGEKPRWSPDQTWPIDAHDVAQAIMTALAYGDRDLARQHMAFAMDRFYAGDGEFRYKAFENGDSNDAVFIRWTQAPMYKTMARYLQVFASDAV